MVSKNPKRHWFLFSLISLLLLVAVTLLFGCSSRGGNQPAVGLTNATAIEIATPAMSKKFPDSFDDCKPYRAQLSDGVWHVYGTLPDGVAGGTPEARVRDTEGVVIEVFLPVFSGYKVREF